MLFLGMPNVKLHKVSNIALVHDWFSSKHFGGAEKTLFIMINYFQKSLNHLIYLDLLKTLRKKL